MVNSIKKKSKRKSLKHVNKKKSKKYLRVKKKMNGGSRNKELKSILDNLLKKGGGYSSSSGLGSAKINWKSPLI